MSAILRIFNSSLGKKYLMAITGVGLFLFVIGHLVGNLQVFLGAEAINRYGHFLQTTPEILWPARVGLLAFVGIHLWTATALTLENRAARAQRYEIKEVVAASYASRTMMVSGLIIASFVIYHLLHFTVQTEAVNLTGKDFHGLVDAQGRHDVYRMMILGFSNAWVATFYVIGVGLLCWHLSHGVSAMFQSLGLTTPAYEKPIEKLATLAAVVIFLGYISIPLAITFGVVK